MATGFTKLFNALFGNRVQAAYNTGFNEPSENFKSKLQTAMIEDYQESVEIEKNWGKEKHALIDGAFDAYKKAGRIENLQILLSKEFQLLSPTYRHPHAHKTYKTLRMMQELIGDLDKRGELTKEKLDVFFEKSAPHEKTAFLGGMLDSALENKDIKFAMTLVNAGVFPKESSADHTIYLAAKIGGFNAQVAEILLKNFPEEKRQAALNGALDFIDKKDTATTAALLAVGAKVGGNADLPAEKRLPLPAVKPILKW